MNKINVLKLYFPYKMLMDASILNVYMNNNSFDVMSHSHIHMNRPHSGEAMSKSHMSHA